MRKNHSFYLFSLLLASALAHAEPAPVEDLGTQAHAARLEQPSYFQRQRIQRAQQEQDDRASAQEDSDENEYDSSEQADDQLTVSQRLGKLERQFDVLSKTSASNQLEQFRDELQQLRGQIEKQQHDVDVLAQQQKQFYQDLSARLDQARQAQSVATIQAPKTTIVQATPAQKSDVVSPEESQQYREAFELLKSKQYSDAISAFQKYLVSYPSGHYTVNSNYWLGEIYYLQGQANLAKKAFTSVIKNYPNSQKMPDALLKLAIIEVEAGNNNEGQRLLEQVQQQYPGTTAARLAALRYQELRLNS